MVKRRTSKRRAIDAVGLEAWSTFFVTGDDTFGELEPFGLTGNARLGSAEAQKAHRAHVDQERAQGHFAINHTTPEQCEQDEAIYKAASEAWWRLGEAFMDSWASRAPSSAPWALEEFGKPWETRRGR